MDDAERARALVDSLPPTEASPSWMFELEKGIAALLRSSRQEQDAARDYLIRNVLQPLHPTIEPLPDLAGVCTQVDNVTAGVVQERDAAVAVLHRIADLEGRITTDHDFARDVLAWVTAARMGPGPWGPPF